MATSTASTTSASAPAAVTRLGESTVQPAGRPLLPPWRRAHDKNPTFADLEAGMITGIRPRIGIIGCPRPGVFCHRDAHHLTARRDPA